jgi:hypothetical protein
LRRRLYREEDLGRPIASFLLGFEADFSPKWPGNKSIPVRADELANAADPLSYPAVEFSPSLLLFPAPGFALFPALLLSLPLAVLLLHEFLVARPRDIALGHQFDMALGEPFELVLN